MARVHAGFDDLERDLAADRFRLFRQKDGATVSILHASVRHASDTPKQFQVTRASKFWKGSKTWTTRRKDGDYVAQAGAFGVLFAR